jgi:hypothetical protein
MQPDNDAIRLDIDPLDCRLGGLARFVSGQAKTLNDATSRKSAAAPTSTAFMCLSISIRTSGAA